MLPFFNEHGDLPAGIHDCTLEEVQSRFGSFQTTDRRPQFWRRFMEFFSEVKSTRMVIAVLLNGSFVTAKPNPNDIDLILVVATTHDFRRDLPRRVQRPLGTTGQTTARNR